MSKNPKPTIEELKFVYELILKGYDDADVLAEYAALYEQGQIMFPYRTDKRFVREHRRELQVAKEVLSRHFEKDGKEVKTQWEHFNQLAEIATVLISDGPDKIDTSHLAEKYDISTYTQGWQEVTHNELIGILEGNIDIACQKYGAWQVFNCLMNHVEAEYPAFTDVYGFIYDFPLQYIDIMRILSQRKTFKGICLVCKEL